MAQIQSTRLPTLEERRQAHMQLVRRMTQDNRHASDRQNRIRQDKARRDQAEQGTDTRPLTLLRPSDLSGEYDASRMLQTTIGGILRPITSADLVAFQKNIATAEARFAGGITTQQVIDWSLAIDRQRATSEIPLAAVYGRKGDTVRYVTNASSGSKDVRHYVDIRFVGWETAITGSRKIGTGTARAIAQGLIRFECDCGRHTYWYRYLATLGKYHLGRAETAFPKIRNPNLSGIACKHVLRVMQVIQSPAGVQYLKAQMDKDRAALDTKQASQRNTAAQVRNELENRADTAHHQRQQVRTTTQRPGYQQQLQRQARLQAEKLAKQEQARATHEQRLTRLRAALKAGLITQEDYDVFVRQKP